VEDMGLWWEWWRWLVGDLIMRWWWGGWHLADSGYDRVRLLLSALTGEGYRQYTTAL
jgi:hypothetical protein